MDSWLDPDTIGPDPIPGAPAVTPAGAKPAAGSASKDWLDPNSIGVGPPPTIAQPLAEPVDPKAAFESTAPLTPPVPKKPAEGGFGAAMARGWANARIGAAALDMLSQKYTGFGQTPEEFAQFAAEQTRRIEANEMSPDEARKLQKILGKQPEGSAWYQPLIEAARDPYGAALITAESIPASAATAAMTIAGGLAPVPGGAAAATFAGSYATDFGPSIVEGLRQAGVDINDAAAVKRAINDPAVIDPIMSGAAKHALPVAALDAASLGIAGKLLAPVRKSIERAAARVGLPAAGKLLGKPVGAAAEIAAQGGAGMAGEFGGQILQSGEITDPGAGAAEFFGEVVPGVTVEPAVNLLTGRKEGAAETPPPPPVVPPGAGAATPEGSPAAGGGPSGPPSTAPEDPFAGLYEEAQGAPPVPPTAPAGAGPAPVEPTAPGPVVPGEAASVLRQSGLTDEDILDIAVNPAALQQRVQEAMAAGIKPEEGAAGLPLQRPAAPTIPAPVAPVPTPGMPPAAVQPSGTSPENIPLAGNVPAPATGLPAPVVPGLPPEIATAGVQTPANLNAPPVVPPAPGLPSGMLPPELATAGVQTPANIGGAGLAANLNVPGLGQPTVPPTIGPAPPAPPLPQPPTPPAQALPVSPPTPAPPSPARAAIQAKMDELGIAPGLHGALDPLLEAAATYHEQGMSVEDALIRAVEDNADATVAPTRKARPKAAKAAGGQVAGPSPEAVPAAPTEAGPSPGPAAEHAGPAEAAGPEGVAAARPDTTHGEHKPEEPATGGERHEAPAQPGPAAAEAEAVPAEGKRPAEQKLRKRTKYRLPTLGLFGSPLTRRPGERGRTYGSARKFRGQTSWAKMWDAKGVRGSDTEVPAKAPDWMKTVQQLADVLSHRFDLPPIKVWAGQPKPGYESSHGGYMMWGSGTDEVAEIIIHSDMSKARAISLFLHEVGHAVAHAKLSQAPKATQDAVQKAYQKWFNDIDANADTMTLRDLSTIGFIDQIGGFDPDTKLSAVKKQDANWYYTYLLSEDEWFADQTMQWLSTEAEPKTAVEKFFAGIAKMWQDIYRLATGHRGTAQEVADFLQGLWDGAQVNEASVEKAFARAGPDIEQAQRISSRFPTTKRAKEDPLGHDLTIGVEAMRHSPEAWEYNTELVTHYPGVKLTATDPDGRAAQFIDHVIGNLLWLYDQVPTATRARSRRWYDGANRIANHWAKQFGQQPHNIAGVMAALSPQKDWFQNVSLAERVLDIHTRFNNAANDMVPPAEMVQTGHRIFGKAQYRGFNQIWMKQPYSKLPNDGTRAMWLRAYDETYNPRGFREVSPEGDFIGEPAGNVAWGSNVEIAKAINSIGSNLEDVSKQMGERNKVRSFFNNILDPNDVDGHGDVTIDTHAVAAGLLRPLSGTSPEVSHNFGNSITPEVRDNYKRQPDRVRNAKNVGDTGAMGLYGLYAEAYKRAAAMRGVLPREMQSITWEAARGLFAPTFKRNRLGPAAINAIWVQAERGNVSVDRARELIAKRAGGIDDPAWHGPNRPHAPASRAASYEGELAGTRIRRGTASGVRPATGGRRNRPSPGFGYVAEPFGGYEAAEAASSSGRGDRGEARGLGRDSAGVAGRARGGVEPADVEQAHKYSQVSDFISGQMGRTVEDIHARSEKLQLELGRAAKEIGEFAAASYVNPGVKNLQTSMEKVGRKGYRDPGYLTDLARIGFIVNSPTSAENVVRMLGDKFDILDENWSVNATGYFDRKVLVRAADGTVGEIQITPKPMKEAKYDKGLGKIYDKERMLPPGPEKDALVAQMTKGYTAAALSDPMWAEVFRSIMRSNESLNLSSQADLESTEPVSRMSETSTSVSQPSPGASLAAARLPSSERIAGRQSQEMKRGIDETPDDKEMMHDRPLFQGGPNLFAPEAEIEHLATGEREFIPMGEVLPDHIVKGLQNKTIAIREHPLGRFRLDKIGTGEGNAVFGWGIYLAEARNVAEWYRDTLTRKGQTHVLVDGDRLYNRDDFVDAIVDRATNGKLDSAQIDQGVYELFADMFDDMLEHGSTVNMAVQATKALNQPTMRQWNRFIDYLGKVKIGRSAIKDQGHIYTATMAAHPINDFLQWRDLLQDQPDPIKAAITPIVQQIVDKTQVTRNEIADRGYVTKLGKRVELTPAQIAEWRKPPNVWAMWTGEDFYDRLRVFLGAKNHKEKAKEASLLLADAGVTGVRYSDQQSMGSVGGGTHNFVLFKEQVAEVIERAHKISPTLMAQQARRNAAAAAAAGVLPSFERPSDPSAEEVGKAGWAHAFLNPSGRAALVHMMRRGLQDSMLDLARVQQAIVAAGGKVGLLSDAYQLSSLYYGKTAKRIEDLLHGRIAPLLKEMGAKGITQKRMDDILKAQHAEERNRAMQAINPGVTTGSGMSDQEAQTIKASVTADEQTYADKIRSIIRDTNQKAWDAGLLSVENAVQFGLLSKQQAVAQGILTQEEVNKIPDPYKNYVPLKGFEGEHSEGSSVGGSGFNVIGSEFRKAFGRDSKADGPMAYIFNDAMRSIIRQEKNQVGIALYRLVVNNPNSELWELDKPSKQISINPQTGMVQVRYGHQAFDAQKPNVLSVKIGGKERHIEIIHAGLADAMKSLTAQDQGMLLRLIGGLTRTLGALNTSLNPEWFLANIIRDVETAMVQMADSDLGVSKQSLRGLRAEVMLNWRKALVGSYRGMKRANAGTQWQKIYEDFDANGGRVNWIDFRQVEQLKDDINDMLAKGSNNKTLFQRAKFAAAATMNQVSMFNSAAENAIRVSTYAALVRRGVPKQVAASAARELTVNFNRKGKFGPTANALYMFFNASVQGNVRLLQSLTKSRAAALAATGYLVLGVIEPLLAEMFDPDDDDWYDRIPDFIKQRNIIIPTGSGGVDPYLKIPIPYGLNLFKTFGQEIGGIGKKSPLEVAITLVSSVIDVANPLGSSMSVANVLAPTFLDPFISLQSNTNEMTGRSIAPADPYSRKPDSQQYFKSASWVAIDMAAFLNIISGGSTYEEGKLSFSPNTLDYIGNFAAGGLWRFASKMIDTSGTISGLMDGELDISRMPFVSTVYGHAGDERALSGAYYELQKRALDSEWSIKAAQKSGDRESVKRMRAEYTHETRILPSIKSVDKQLKTMKEQETVINNNPSFSREQRFERIDRITKRRAKLEADLLKRWRDIGGQ